MEKINNKDEKSILKINKSIKIYVSNINFIINKSPKIKTLYKKYFLHSH